MLREFLLEGPDLGIHDQDTLDSIADLMNKRPRQMQGWKSPYQGLQQFLQAIEQRRGATMH